MRRRSLQTAIASIALLALMACGDDDAESPDGSESPEAPTSSVESSSPGDPSDSPGDPGWKGGKGKTDKGDKGGEQAGLTVAREPFCSDMDPAEVADLLGVDDLQVLAENAPGDEVTPAPGGQPTVSAYWTCTLGQSSADALGVTWNIGNVEAAPADATGTLDRLAGILGRKNCTNVGDEALGPGTRGIDCSGTAGSGDLTTSFTTVVRTVVVGGTQLECYLASTDPDDLDTFRAAAPAVCALFHDAVVS